ncbi:MAG: laccase domain protein [Firmicutes bacterium]|nr:laccase domain protein [Bacillota bacterium]
MNEFFLKKSKNNIWYGLFSHFYHAGIRHGISTRLGGVSSLPYMTLNLGMHTGDYPVKVQTNRQLFCNAVGVNYRSVVSAQQVHKDTIAIVTQADAGKGVDCYADALCETDALVTANPDIPLLLLYADCVPVLFFDPVQRVIGVAHAGWKGTVAQIAVKTLTTMQECFGSRSADCLVGIGPSIGPCCYEVDDGVINPLRAGFHDWEDVAAIHGERRWMLNLWEVNRRQLLENGVLAANIAVAEVCTSCNNELFFSYRAEGGCTGRIGALISL